VSLARIQVQGMIYAYLTEPQSAQISDQTLLSVSTRLFLDEINIEVDRLSKADCPQQCGWFSFNQLN
jgi:hypothetical protein